MVTRQVPDDSEQVLARVHAELPLVEIIASQVARTIGGAIEYDDLLGAGREGLLDAARRFDESLGVPFRAYANLRIRGAVIDSVRAQSPLSKKALDSTVTSEALLEMSEGSVDIAFENSDNGAQLAEDQYANHLASMATAAAIRMTLRPKSLAWEISADEQATPEEQLTQAQLEGLVRRTIDELDFVEAAVLRAYYFEGKSFSELASTLNMSKSWACRLHAQAMERFTKLMKQSL